MSAYDTYRAIWQADIASMPDRTKAFLTASLKVSMYLNPWLRDEESQRLFREAVYREMGEPLPTPAP